MRRSLPSLVATLTLAFAVAHARAQQEPQMPPATLHVGDLAPALKVGKWVKGEPVSTFAPGTVYVVECWATWCGPCRAAIPHVTEMQKKYEGKAVFIGANVWETEDGKVEPFVQEMGDKMGYRVVMDDKSTDDKGAFATTWMAAAAQPGIPCSFLINQEGKIAWIGHPMELEPVLQKVIDGKYDIKAAAMDAAARAEVAKKVQAANATILECEQKGDVAGAMAAVDQLEKDAPEVGQRAALIRLQIYMQMKQYDKAYALGDKALNAVKDDPETLNSVAWNIATGEGIEKRDLKLAQKFAERGVEVTKHADAGVLDTLARVQFDQGNVDAALQTQTEAVAKAPPEMKADLTDTLEKYKRFKK